MQPDVQAIMQDPFRQFGGIDLAYPLERLLDNVRGYREAGLSAVKIKVGRPEGDDTERVAAVRELIGPEAAFMVDANYSLTVEDAIDARKEALEAEQRVKEADQEVERIERESPTLGAKPPEGAVVVPGSRAVTVGKGRDWGLALATPVIVKYRDERTDARTELEKWLR